MGTWNVAGRSPVGSLAVDVDEWLNLKDAADIYVLGLSKIEVNITFCYPRSIQEILLNTIT